MCLIFIGLKVHPRYKLVIAANRDEFYKRKTTAASFWHDEPSLLAGRDLEAGGTWLGVTREGKIAMVTNYRDPHNLKASAPSRGHLVTEFLLSGISAEAYMRAVSDRASEYNGFNLLAGDADTLFYFSNYGGKAQKLEYGLFGLSNHLLESPWPKVVRGKEKMRSLLSHDDIAASEIFSILEDEKIAADTELPDTGVGLERERALSAMFIKSPGYGTRSSTVILVDESGNLHFTERVYDLSTFQYTEQTFLLPPVKDHAI